MEKEEDERREKAIASRPSLQPNFVTKSVSQSQLSKFHELRRRRLQIKAKSKTKPKGKGPPPGKHNRPHGKSLDYEEPTEEMSNKETDEASSVSISKSCTTKDQDGTEAGHPVLKKRQKLHWGLDTKERWERKANM